MSTSLHAFFALRNQKGFQRHLDACRLPSSASSNAALSSSGGRSWSKSSNLHTGDVNARDRFGRTVLHLACSALDPAATTFVKLLLAHPSVNVNLQDSESSWTALHRALYAGNLAARYANMMFMSLIWLKCSTACCLSSDQTRTYLSRTWKAIPRLMSSTPLYKAPNPCLLATTRYLRVY